MGDVTMDSKINAEDNIGNIFVADMNVHVEWYEESESIYLISYTASQTFCMEKSLIFSKIGQTSESKFLSIFKLILNEFKGVLHPRSVFGLFLYFSQKLQHIGNK